MQVLLRYKVNRPYHLHLNSSDATRLHPARYQVASLVRENPLISMKSRLVKYCYCFLSLIAVIGPGWSKSFLFYCTVGPLCMFEHFGAFPLQLQVVLGVQLQMWQRRGQSFGWGWRWVDDGWCLMSVSQQHAQRCNKNEWYAVGLQQALANSRVESLKLHARDRASDRFMAKAVLHVVLDSR